MTTWVDAAAADELADGEFRIVEVGGVIVALYRIGDGYYAIEDVCTHDGGELAGGPVDGYTVECLRHGAVFDLRDGAALCPPAYTPTRSLRTRVDVGRVWIEALD